MAERIFQELVAENTAKQKHVCVGLDTDIRRIKTALQEGVTLHTDAHPNDGQLVLAWNRMVLEAAEGIPGAYKPNRAFYAALGRDGMDILQRTVAMVNSIQPEALVILF